MFIWINTHYSVSSFCSRAMGPINGDARYPLRPCMLVNSCGPDNRTPDEKASDPYDKNNPASLEARANKADSPKQESTIAELEVR